jgi:hypothetical protein
MKNPFEELRKKREAAQAKLLENIELEKVARAKAEEEQKYALDLSNQYTYVVTRVLNQLLEAAYPDLEICDYSDPDSWDPDTWDAERAQRKKPWRPTWCIGHTQVYDFKDEENTQFLSWDFAIKVRIDFDKNHKPLFICTRGERTIACDLSEDELIKTLLELDQ